MKFDVSSLDKAGVYRLFTHTILPRPIAWVLTDSGHGQHNLAPFSYFNVVSSDPAVLMISVGRKHDGSPKDTWLNIEQRQQATVHIANTVLAESLNETAKSLPFGESELTGSCLDLVHEADFSLPRITQAPVAFAGQLFDMHLMGDSQAVIYLKIHAAYINDDIINPETQQPDAALLDPLARLGGTQYSAIAPPFSLARPK